MQKRKTIIRETAVKKDRAGKIGKEPKPRKDKVASDIRSSLKTEKININLQSPVANGLLKLAKAIKDHTRSDSTLMKSLKSLEDSVIRVEQVRKPATRIARKAIADISEIPDIKQSLFAVKQTLANAKKEISESVKKHLEEIEKKIKESNPSEFDDIKERLRKLTEDLD